MISLFKFFFTVSILCIGLLPNSAWSCLSNPLWQDTMRCQFYPTAAQTPPPPPTAPTSADQLGAFTRVDLPALNADGQPMRCVDGTRPIIYVDEAVGGKLSNDWLITFQGGGSCSSGQSCLDAYLSPNEESEMGSAFQPAMKNLAGIHSTLKTNKFRRFNRVRIHKCGYDRYNGASVVNSASGTVDDNWNQNDTPLEPINSPLAMDYDSDLKSVLEGGTYTFDLYHQGQQHVLHALDQLLGGLNYQTWVKSGESTQIEEAILPPLQQARTILFAGHSGAAHGLMHNIDNLVDHMTNWSQNQGETFEADVRALFDAQLLPSIESEAAFVDEQTKDLYDHETECPESCEGSPPLKYHYNGEDYFSSGGIGGPGYFDGPHQEWNTQLDASCVAEHPSELWRCADRFHVLYNHITTPFFIREDFRDPNGQHNNNPAGPANEGHRLFWATPELRHCSDPMAIEPCLPVLSEADFRVRVEEQAERLKIDFTTRSELALNNLPVPTVYVWLPDCGSHKGAFDSHQFFNTRVQSDLYGIETTMHDFLFDFMQTPPVEGFDSRIDGDEDWRSICN